jgi:hypothetical protein
MHSAPSVSYPGGRSRHADRLLLALWLRGAGAVALACVQSAGMGWRGGVLFLCVVVAAVGAWMARFRSTGGTDLVFDGQHWSMSGGVEAPMARASVMLDLQALLLIRLTGAAGRARWVWAERRAMPERWRDLRRALYSRAAPAEPAEVMARPPGSASAKAQYPLP